MRCPGQDTQYWDEEAIYEVNCPKCNAAVEFYKDDTQRKCHSCGHRFVNPKMDFGCASYCQFAEQCIGTLPEGVVISSDNLLKDKVAVEMKRFFQKDFHRIGRAMRLARYTEPIAKAEGATLAPTLCAAYLFEVEQASIEAEGNSQLQKASEQILVKAGAEKPLIQQVLSLLEALSNLSSSPGPELLSLNDAKHILEVEERYKSGELSLEEFKELPKELKTHAGIHTAEKLIGDFSNNAH